MLQCCGTDARTDSLEQPTMAALIQNHPQQAATRTPGRAGGRLDMDRTITPYLATNRHIWMDAVTLNVGLSDA